MINNSMRIFEILLPKGSNDKSLSPQATKQVDFLQKRIQSYVDKIADPNTSPAGREFLKSRLKDDYYDLKGLLRPIYKVDTIAEAIYKLPLTPADFDLIKQLMEKPIPAIVATLFISEVIEDDELTDQFNSLEETDPGRDIRPLIVEWINRVMPDQMHRFGQETASEFQRKGTLSPIHGYDSKTYKGSGGVETSGNAYGMF